MFPRSFEVSGIKEPVAFPDVDAVREYVDREIEDWSHAKKLLEGAASRSALARTGATYANDSLNLWSSLRDNVRELAGSIDRPEADLRALVSRIEQLLRHEKIIASRAPVPAAALAIANGDPERAALLLSLHSPARMTERLSRHEATAFSELVAAVAQTSRAASDADRASATSQLERAAQEFEARAQEAGVVLRGLQDDARRHAAAYGESQQDLARERDIALGEIATAAATQRELIDAQWKGLRDAVQKEVKLQAPRNYWSGRAVAHLRWASGWLVAFAVFLVGLVVVPVALFETINEALEPAQSALGEAKWIVPAVALGAPIFVLLWLARFAGRQLGEQLLRREDANERVTMLETYLALTHTEAGSDVKQALDEQLPIVLQALFRAGPGLHADDSPPLGAIDALIKRLSGQGR